MSRKQEFVGRVRYGNSLPAPLVPPRLLEYTRDPKEDVAAPELLSSLYAKTNVRPLVDIDRNLSMPVDLLKIPHFLTKMDTSLLQGFDNVKLQSKDRVLLRDPAADRVARTDTSKVGFLRRTEYVSTSLAAKQHGSERAQRKRPRTKDVDDEMDCGSLKMVERVEATFENNEELRHPVKKHVRAVKTWDLLPDTASMDQNYFLLRLVGSAALQKQERDQLALETAIFRPVELEEDEWMSLYTTDLEDSKLLNNDLVKTIDEGKEISNADPKAYVFKRLRDFDMKHILNQNSEQQPLAELAIEFNDEMNIAYYKPLRSRIELRRRRVNDILKSIVRENNVDQINIQLRNPTPKESNMRDRMRTTFDPINFATVDDEDEEVEKSVNTTEHTKSEVEELEVEKEVAVESDKEVKEDPKPETT